jgi:hypothetical protein
MVGTSGIIGYIWYCDWYWSGCRLSAGGERPVNLQKECKSRRHEFLDGGGSNLSTAPSPSPSPSLASPGMEIIPTAREEARPFCIRKPTNDPIYRASVISDQGANVFPLRMPFLNFSLLVRLFRHVCKPTPIDCGCKENGFFSHFFPTGVAMGYTSS